MEKLYNLIEVKEIMRKRNRLKRKTSNRNQEMISTSDKIRCIWCKQVGITQLSGGHSEFDMFK